MISGKDADTLFFEDWNPPPSAVFQSRSEYTTQWDWLQHKNKIMTLIYTHDFLLEQSTKGFLNKRKQNINSEAKSISEVLLQMEAA